MCLWIIIFLAFVCVSPLDFVSQLSYRDERSLCSCRSQLDRRPQTIGQGLFVHSQSHHYAIDYTTTYFGETAEAPRSSRLVQNVLPEDIH